MSEILALYGSPLEAGRPAFWIQVPTGSLRTARRGSVYMLQLDVSPLTREKADEAVRRLAEGLREKFNAELLYARAESNRLSLQIRGSPFSWLALFAWLPAILGLLGITIFGISVWQMVTSIPTWVWATMAIGAALIVLGPSIGEWILSSMERMRK